MKNVPQKGFDASTNTLNDNKFIGSTGKGAADMDPIERNCHFCFYRNEGEPSDPIFKHTVNGKEVFGINAELEPGAGNCSIGEEGDTAKKLFGYTAQDIMPTKIDGKEVGNFCSHWFDFRRAE